VNGEPSASQIKAGTLSLWQGKPYGQHRFGFRQYAVEVRPPLRFDILKRGRQSYVTTRKRSGWVKSSVLNRSLRLTGQVDATGNPEYSLDIAE
jgi:hypothetical protein